MSKTIKFKKGYDIKIIGTPKTTVHSNFKAKTHAVKPTDFIGISPIPKLTVDVGDRVKAGDTLFYDKKRPEILYTAPVSGEVVEIKRGAKRSLAAVVILADEKMSYKLFNPVRISSASRNEIVKFLMETGCWPFIRQRPYNVIANPDEQPKNIFISGFKTAPLAPDTTFLMKGQEGAFSAGVSVLKKLTKGKVYLSLSNKQDSQSFSQAKDATINHFSGPHPAGNVGVHIHHIAPINKGDVVWTLDPQDVILIGKLFNTGKYDTERLVALGGTPVSQPQYYKTYLGASIKNMVANNLNKDHVRFVSGDILTGEKIAADGHVGAFHQQVTVVEEGDHYEFLGWLKPSYARPSVSRTFMSFMKPNKEYDVNTNTHGEHRAFVVTGAYEKVIPMDVLPMQLLKAILYRDFELMEGLGIYEVVEEDLALCEFICPSKTDMQEILREGLDYMREQA
ncbi:MAG: Na(+)-translocating NADH-quinone reductase subunit A [Chitinophagales bacterium]